MGFFITLLMIAIGLSMDAFAVSVTNGLCYGQMNKKQAFLIPLTFGIFQGVMAVIGYFLGNTVSSFIETVDHFIAFLILEFIGLKMIVEIVREKEKKITIKAFNLRELLVQGIATSIDSLAVGLSFAALSVEIWLSSLVIASVTFGICLLGVLIGKKFGCYFKDKAVIAGGIILMLIGFKILGEHLLWF